MNALRECKRMSLSFRCTLCLLALPARPRPLPRPSTRSFVIKKAEQRYRELDAMGISVRLICVGRKGSAYFRRRPQYKIEGEVIR